METKEIKNKRIEEITDVICDCCGQSCRVHEGRVDNEAREDFGESYSIFEFMKIEKCWGYWSSKDTEKWTAQICEKCVDEKLSFIKFKKERYL